jgi:hypothetical protein
MLPVLVGHHALDLTLEEAHLSQKTPHDLRARLMGDDQGQLAFQATTARILAALGTDVGRQRLDSTHVMSNMAMLTRLRVFYETTRVFPQALEKGHPSLTAADFYLDDGAEGVSRCPAGHTPTQQTPHGKSGRRATLHFERSTCETCPLHPYCPEKRAQPALSQPQIGSPEHWVCATESCMCSVTTRTTRNTSIRLWC